MQLTRILYVEDDPDIRDVAVMALEHVGGFTVLACESGAQAIAQGVAFDPQLILLDAMMPEMDGPATLKALRENRALAGTVAVFMTAKVQPSEVAEFLRLGAADVVAKPFDPMTLAATITEIWARTAVPGARS